MNQRLTDWKRPTLIVLLGLVAAVGLLHRAHLVAADKAQPNKKAQPNLPTTAHEARGRAKLLHDTLSNTLQVVHRDFFDDENPNAIPSRSLEDVFEELHRNHHVEVRWLIVDTDVVNVDHQPQSDFDKQAVKALAAGKDDFEATTDNTYRHAGPIRLGSQCLKCHVKNRTSTRARTAGLIISMPLKTSVSSDG